MIYEKATAEVILFDNSDVITASDIEGACNNGSGNGGGHNKGCGNGSSKKNSLSGRRTPRLLFRFLLSFYSSHFVF